MAREATNRHIQFDRGFRLSLGRDEARLSLDLAGVPANMVTLLSQKFQDQFNRSYRTTAAPGLSSICTGKPFSRSSFPLAIVAFRE